MSTVPQLPRFAVVGDSISIQYGPPLKQFSAGVFESRPKDLVDTGNPDSETAAGVYAGDSKALVACLAARAREWEQVDLLAVNAGLHDLRTDPETGAKQVPLAEYRANLLTVPERIRALGAEPVWITTTPVREEQHNTAAAVFHRFNCDVLEYNRTAMAIMRQQGVPHIDLYTFTVNLGTDLHRDGVHFADRVRELQAAFLAGWLHSFAYGRNACKAAT